MLMMYKNFIQIYLDSLKEQAEKLNLNEFLDIKRDIKKRKTSVDKIENSDY